jgi:Rho GTPase-activating protein 1
MSCVHGASHAPPLTPAASSLTSLAESVHIQNLLIPSSTYLTDRRISEDIYVQHASGRRAFGARSPFPMSSSGKTRFPRVLRETTSFVLMEENITSEGLFRVPPHSKLRDVLKEAYDRGQKYIMWKDNGVTLPVPPYRDAEHQDEILAEVDPKDAYSVFMAAALIKAWYASLRQPIFPTTSYGDLRRLYGDAQDVPDLDRLRDLFSPNSEWSLLPGSSREIIVRHLLPLLDAVAARQEQNKMTAENLAVCFAPALLCGPDQIEDAKMSSIIRRIFTHAVDMWSNGLRDACEQSPHVFYEELRLPKDESDWDDPVDETKTSGEGKQSLEEQTSGITLEDNEKSFEAYPQPYPEVSHDDMPPPLPPRSRVPSAKSSTDSAKRKPAPPLQVAPPRYSTVISDAPEDVAESPVTYALTTDGFAPQRPDEERAPPLPPRWEQVSDDKSGTRISTSIPASSSALPNTQTGSSPVSGYPAKPYIPKRKILTAAQVDNIEKSVTARSPSSASETAGMTEDSHTRTVYQPRGGMALPGLTKLPALSTSDRSAHSTAPERTSREVPSFTQSEQASPVTTTSPLDSSSKPSSAIEFRRPSVPASANRIPTITGLARPVYPSTPMNPVTGRPPSKSTSLPVPGPKPRAISPGLLHRMPSFEARQQPNDFTIERKMLTPKKLNLKKQSVEDLRKLYEERAGTASMLVGWNRNQ